ncbi:MAG: hypothetical protein V1798_10400 [Pseudomonadota bacterium]
MPVVGTRGGWQRRGGDPGTYRGLNGFHRRGPDGRDRFYFGQRWGHRVQHRLYPRYRDFAPTFCGYYYDHGYWPRHRFRYGWGWIPAWWWNGYGYYYSPYGYYPDPTYWLTDYLFIWTIYSSYPPAYDQRYEEGYAQGSRDAWISQEVKDQIRSQVREEIDRNRTDGQEPPSLADALNNPRYLFVVSEEFSATLLNGSSEGETCSLSEGDVLKVVQPPGQDEDVARMTVVTSKRNRCPAGSEVLVSLDYLQNFLNHASEGLESGFQRLEKDQTQLGQ